MPPIQASFFSPLFFAAASLSSRWPRCASRSVEHGYIEDDTTHHEINLVFAADLGHADPVSQEDHLEFHWLTLADLAAADVRPGGLKDALVAATDTPFWHPWQG